MGKYVPPFTISNKMLELVGSIMEKVGKLDNYSNLNKMPVLRRNNRIHSIHSSLAIEANSLSFNQVKDVINGNPEKDRKPITTFINEVNMYPGLLDIIINIEGLVNKRGIHASGVILYGDDPFDTASFMKAPNGELITCYDLHKAEAAGDTKYDFLVTEVSDKIIKCFELLAKDKVIEDMESAIKGMLDPTYEEVILGEAEVRQIFKFSKIGNIAGSHVNKGIIKNGADARVIRDGIVVYTGKIGSLQREKDSVKEVKNGYDCGITIESFQDIKEGDIIEAFTNVEVKK